MSSISGTGIFLNAFECFGKNDLLDFKFMHQLSICKLTFQILEVDIYAKPQSWSLIR